MINLATPPLGVPKWAHSGNVPEDLTVACVFYGTKYPVSYVYRLQRAVHNSFWPEESQRKVRHRFVCLSDREIDGVETIPLPPLVKGVEGWWQKTNLFWPGIFKSGSRVLYLDLDVVVTGNLGVLAGMETTEPLTMIYNFGPNRSHCAHNSSVMLWTADDERVHHLWQEYQNDSARIMRTLHGDQCWFWRCLPDSIANFPRDYIKSYKYDVRGKQLDPQTRVVVFHGDPKPHQCREDWVQKYWA